MKKTNLLMALCLCSISLSASLSAAAQTVGFEPQSRTTGSDTRTIGGGTGTESSDGAYDAVMALKTNLPFWLVGGVNVGLEFPIGDKFSATASFATTRITIDNTYAIQTLQGGLDFKYWFNRGERSLTGWNVGLYGVYGGRYDVQWKTGWQGDSFTSVGVQGGYSLPIGRRLNLEFLLAVGWFHTPEARKVSTEGGRVMWEETRTNVNRFTPTKAQVNLVWLIGK